MLRDAALNNEETEKHWRSRTGAGRVLFSSKCGAQKAHRSCCASHDRVLAKLILLLDLLHRIAPLVDSTSLGL